MSEMDLHLSDEWDKTFPKSDHVDHEKVTFHNRYGIALAADLYRPRSVEPGVASPRSPSAGRSVRSRSSARASTRRRWPSAAS